MKPNKLALFVRQLMFNKSVLFVESFVTMFTSESVHPGVFRLVVFHVFPTFKDFSTILAWISSTFMTSHVLFKIVAVIETLSTRGTKERILSSMVLYVLIKSRLRCECLVALATLQDLHFSAEF